MELISAGGEKDRRLTKENGAVANSYISHRELGKYRVLLSVGLNTSWELGSSMKFSSV